MTAADLQTLLAAADRPWWRRGLIWIVAAALAAASLLLWLQQARRNGGAALQWITQPVVRGTLAVRITATGTLQPTRSVAVGSELSGTVAQVRADVNDRVRKGQPLVELDRAKLSEAVRGARAELAAARAREQQAAATASETRSRLARLDEAWRLSQGGIPSAVDLDAARAAAERAVAEQASARAAIEQAASTLATAETNLGKSSIRSPIDGVVLSRNVEPGNAVAASLQAVTLFTLAEDLRSMKLNVNVDEADVAQLRQGQRARFTVAAHPGREYPATVSRVAFGSTITDNVVTYTTQLDVDNADLSLRPGMTATAIIATVERSGVLLVPNSALRFRPQQASGAAASGSGGSGLVARLMPRPPGMGTPRRSSNDARAGTAQREGSLWLLREGQPVALKVLRGLSDGRQTEVSGEGLAEGDAVIVDQAMALR